MQCRAAPRELGMGSETWGWMFLLFSVAACYRSSAAVVLLLLLPVAAPAPLLLLTLLLVLRLHFELVQRLIQIIIIIQQDGLSIVL